jgi:hypothetical protein
MTIEDMIYRDGYVAYIHGHSVMHNPYPESNANQSLWEAGFVHGRDNGVEVRYIRSDAHRNAEDREG